VVVDVVVVAIAAAALIAPVTFVVEAVIVFVTLMVPALSLVGSVTLESTHSAPSAAYSTAAEGTVVIFASFLAKHSDFVVAVAIVAIATENANSVVIETVAVILYVTVTLPLAIVPVVSVANVLMAGIICRVG